MTDDPGRWSRIKEIFHFALTCVPEQRAAFVRDACGEDVALRNEVESLLAAHAAAGSFAERAAIDELFPVEAPISYPVGPALAPGDELGRYRILKPLDAGGMGEVYKALDTGLHREVAIKVLPAALSGDPQRIARLEREARLLAALNHPHIATIHGLEFAGGRHAIVMELVDGPTLADRLARGPLPVDLALEISRQIAVALEAAHEKGIVHRDLKPANIALTGTGTVKVLDFGLAKALAADQSSIRTTPAGAEVASTEGLVAGTPAYMSPEQARGHDVDARSDVWAFGCVVFEMLTGRSAFGRPTVAETFAAVLQREPEWERLPSNVPAGVRRMLRRCLERNRNRRLHHIADARIEIEDAASDPDQSAPQVTVSSRRERVLAISTVALLLTFAAVLTAWFLRPAATVPERRVVEITTPRMPDPWSFALSPDGRRIAFVADHDGQPMLWVRALDVAGAQALSGTEGARRPFWSPDSRAIGFFAGSEMKRVDAGGGSVQVVTYVLAGTTAAWGADGTILFSSTASSSLRRVSAAGGAVQDATTAAANSTGHRHPQFLPGGRQFLFFVGGVDAVRGVYLGSLGSSSVIRLLPSDTQAAYVAPGLLLFVRQRMLLAQPFDLARGMVSGEPVTVADSVAFDPITGTGAFSVSDGGLIAYRTARPSVTTLSWFDRSGNALGTLGPTELVDFSNVRLSPDGRRVAGERTIENETDLWLLDGTHQIRFTRGADGRMERLPLWSPDGNRIAFESVRSGSVALAEKPSGGDGIEEVLFASPDIKIPCDWSPDGQFLMYYVPDPKTGTDLWVLQRGSRTPVAFLRTEANELWGQFSPDGRWVAYQSNETGRYEIYLRPFPAGGGPIPVSTAGGVYPRWSHDGRELFFISPDAKMMAVPIRGTATMVEAGPPVTLFATRRLGGGLNVIGRSHQYDVDADGRFLINAEVDSSIPQAITLVMNWRARSGS